MTGRGWATAALLVAVTAASGCPIRYSFDAICRYDKTTYVGPDNRRASQTPRDIARDLVGQYAIDVAWQRQFQNAGNLVLYPELEAALGGLVPGELDTVYADVSFAPGRDHVLFSDSSSVSAWCPETVIVAAFVVTVRDQAGRVLGNTAGEDVNGSAGPGYGRLGEGRPLGAAVMLDMVPERWAAFDALLLEGDVPLGMRLSLSFGDPTDPSNAVVPTAALQLMASNELYEEYVVANLDGVTTRVEKLD